LTEDFDKDILKNRIQEPEVRSQKSGVNLWSREVNAPEESERTETDVVMTKDREKTIRTKSIELDSYKKGKSSFSSTLEMSPKTFIGKITATRHAFLEVMGEKKERIFIGEDEVIIGRTPDCDIQLLVENVSRWHARIIYKNEEYQVEDLDSTNGVYVNGVKVERCILRQHDIIEIGGVKIQFIEEKIGQDHDLK
jgi:hypothetical protein